MWNMFVELSKADFNQTDVKRLLIQKYNLYEKWLALSMARIKADKRIYLENVISWRFVAEGAFIKIVITIFWT